MYDAANGSVARGAAGLRQGPQRPAGADGAPGVPREHGPLLRLRLPRADPGPAAFRERASRRPPDSRCKRCDTAHGAGESAEPRAGSPPPGSSRSAVSQRRELSYVGCTANAERAARPEAPASRRQAARRPRPTKTLSLVKGKQQFCFRYESATRRRCSTRWWTWSTGASSRSTGSTPPSSVPPARPAFGERIEGRICRRKQRKLVMRLSVGYGSTAAVNGQSSRTPERPRRRDSGTTDDERLAPSTDRVERGSSHAWATGIAGRVAVIPGLVLVTTSAL